MPGSRRRVDDEETPLGETGWRRRVGVGGAPLVFGLLWWDPLGWLASLTAAQAHLTAILALVILLWVTEALPLALTALAGAVLCVLFRIESADAIFAAFADPIIFLFIGSFMLGRAMQAVGLDRRFAWFILGSRALSGSPYRLLLAIGVAGGSLSSLISNTAAAAMLYPIVLGVLDSLPDVDATRAARRRFACGAMLMVSFAVSVGGVATPIGTPPNGIAIGFLRQTLGLHLGFVDWVKLALPITGAAALVVFAWVSFLYARGYPRQAFRPQMVDFPRVPWSRGERVVGLAFLLAIALWVVPDLAAQVGGALWGTEALAVRWVARLGQIVPLPVPALLAVWLLFLWPRDRAGRAVVEWHDLIRIDWSTILLFGGGMALGEQMLATGLAETAGRMLLGLTGVDTLWGLTALGIALAVVMSESTSNTSSANMVVPMMIVLAESLGVSPVPPALGAALGASFGFMLPVSTPPNAIVYGTGRVPLLEMVKAGVGLDLAGGVVVWLGLRLLCPALGLV